MKDPRINFKLWFLKWVKLMVQVRLNGTFSSGSYHHNIYQGVIFLFG